MRRPADLRTLDLVRFRADRAAALARRDGSLAPITRALPVARTVTLGGEPHVATELTLQDLAEIQAWLEEREPNPMDGMPPAWADPEPATRLARLKRAWEAARDWPVRLGSERAAGLLGEPAGRCFFLYLVLAKADPRFGPAEALELLPRITPVEWAALRRVAWAIAPRVEIAAELAPDDGAGRAVDWPRSVHRATQGDAAMSYDQVGALTLSQWRNLCSEGKPWEHSAEFGAIARRVGRVLSGDVEDPLRRPGAVADEAPGKPAGGGRGVEPGSGAGARDALPPGLAPRLAAAPPHREIATPDPGDPGGVVADDPDRHDRGG